LNAADYALGIDLGTSGTRTCVIDSQSKVIDEQQVAGQRITRPQPGWAEQHPEHWWHDVIAVIHKIDNNVRERIAALAIDGTSSTLLLCDAQGNACTQALMYNDTRAQEQAITIGSVAPAESAAHGASSSLAKLLWLLKNTSPHSIQYAMHQADWIANRLSGQWGYSDFNNSLKLGYDPINQHWPDWLNRLDFDLDILPCVLTPGRQMDQISLSAAIETGLPRTTRIITGTTDSIAAFMATGANEPGDAVTSLGSTLVLKTLSEHPIFAPEYGIYSHKYLDTWLVGGASNSGGAVLKQYFSNEEIRQYSARIVPHHSSGLDYYPLPSTGERFPISDPTFKPQLKPIPQNDPAKFLHGLLEGIAKIEQLGYEKLSQLGAHPIEKVITVGGGAQNPQWTLIRERLLDKPVEIPKHTEAAYGVAKLALAGIN
jgi:sugar (pentulose or hexulose) kinase